MRGIRERRPGRFSVTVSVNGVDKHIGTFGTVDEAVRVRDEARHERRGRAAPMPVAKKRVAKGTGGIQEIFTASGVAYDVVMTVRRQTVYGGRFTTLELAVAEAERIRANPPPPLPDTMTKLSDPGISVTFHRPRGSRKDAPKVARYHARDRKGERDGGGKTVGTFDTLQAARAALGLIKSVPSDKQS